MTTYTALVQQIPARMGAPGYWTGTVALPSKGGRTRELSAFSATQTGVVSDLTHQLREQGLGGPLQVKECGW